jgi:hypothetical protein
MRLRHNLRPSIVVRTRYYLPEPYLLRTGDFTQNPHRARVVSVNGMLRQLTAGMPYHGHVRFGGVHEIEP